MPTEIPLRVSMPVCSLQHRKSTARRWTPRRVIGAVVGVWVAVTALLVAVVVAIAWDVRP